MLLSLQDTFEQEFIAPASFCTTILSNTYYFFAKGAIISFKGD
ncbi:hypothetical protein [Evansella sp. LMS18]|jgi:hypothetical protein|nr:hypothetical protein [Evansella sp. LMS18]